MSLDAAIVSVLILIMVWTFFYCWMKVLCWTTILIATVIGKIKDYYECTNRT